MLSDLLVFQKVYEFVLWVKPTVQRFERVHKYSLGQQLENETLQLLKDVARANLKRDKAASIEDCLVCYELVKVLVRLSKDFKLLSIKQYEFAAVRLDEIGRLLNGWKNKFGNINKPLSLQKNT
ncbi:MAG: diversity-generating retroelement protein Avd [Patescibacteria group bacterium]|nr:diversity-generating retroelement protein Avd [Patescibacteria group bacterium]